MKIVKELNANDWAKQKSPGMTSPNNQPYWSWGLGDDGVLYGKGQISGYVFTTAWYPYERIGFGISIREMKRIVKEFGHLLIWT